MKMGEQKEQVSFYKWEVQGNEWQNRGEEMQVEKGNRVVAFLEKCRRLKDTCLSAELYDH